MKIAEYLALPLETRRRLIKRLIRETIPDGEVKETAWAAGLEPYTLYKMRDENRETHDLLRPELLAILAAHQDLRLLQWLAGLFGQALVLLPRPGASAGNLSREIARTIKNFGEHLSVLTGALEEASPGGAQLTASEYGEIAATAEAVIRQILGLKEAARMAQAGAGNA